MAAGLRLGLGAGREDGRHALLVAEGQGVVEGGVQVRAVDAVAPGLVGGGVGEGSQGSPGHLGSPLLLLRGGEIVEANLGQHGGVTDDAVTLFCSQFHCCFTAKGLKGATYLNNHPRKGGAAKEVEQAGALGKHEGAGVNDAHDTTSAAGGSAGGDVVALDGVAGNNTAVGVGVDDNLLAIANKLIELSAHGRNIVGERGERGGGAADGGEGNDGGVEVGTGQLRGEGLEGRGELPSTRDDEN